MSAFLYFCNICCKNVRGFLAQHCHTNQYRIVRYSE